MLLVGLTGGIGSGKSTVTDLLRERGAVVLDADDFARAAVVAGSPGLRKVAQRFGPEVLGPDGELDRRKLASIVFADPAALSDLEAIVHPEPRLPSEASVSFPRAVPCGVLRCGRDARASGALVPRTLRAGRDPRRLPPGPCRDQRRPGDGHRRVPAGVRRTCPLDDGAGAVAPVLAGRLRPLPRRARPPARRRLGRHAVRSVHRPNELRLVR